MTPEQRHALTEWPKVLETIGSFEIAGKSYKVGLLTPEQMDSISADALRLADRVRGRECAEVTARVICVLVAQHHPNLKPKHIVDDLRPEHVLDCALEISYQFMVKRARRDEVRGSA